MKELKRLHIYAGEAPSQTILTMEEVFDLMGQRLREGLKLNIELKTSVFPYPGIEEKIVELVHRKCTSETAANIVYSSFYTLSLERIRGLEPEARIGILDEKVSNCLFKCRCAASILERDGPPKGTAGRLSGAGLADRTPVSGEAHRRQTGSGGAGTAGDYRCIFE